MFFDTKTFQVHYTYNYCYCLPRIVGIFPIVGDGCVVIIIHVVLTSCST